MVEYFISKYTQDDVIVEPISNISESITFNIYSNGAKQLHSLINMISDDFNVIEFAYNTSVNLELTIQYEDIVANPDAPFPIVSLGRFI